MPLTQALTNYTPINDGNWYLDADWSPAPHDNVYYRTDVTHNGNPSWQVSPFINNTAVDHHPIAIVPGQQLTLSAWIKTNGTYTTEVAGARIGYDYYHDATRIAGGQLSAINDYVHWGEDWTLRSGTFIVPATVTADGLGGYEEGTTHTPNYIIFWMQIWDSNDYPTNCHSAWFSEPQLLFTGASITQTNAVIEGYGWIIALVAIVIVFGVVFYVPAKELDII